MFDVEGSKLPGYSYHSCILFQESKLDALAKCLNNDLNEVEHFELLIE